MFDDIIISEGKKDKAEEIKEKFDKLVESQKNNK